MGPAKFPEMASEQGSHVPEPRDVVFMMYEDMMNEKTNLTA